MPSRQACRAWVRALAGAGVLRACVPEGYGGLRRALDVRTLSRGARTARVSNARWQTSHLPCKGWAAAPIALFGSDDLCRRYLPEVAAGRSIAAFALSEREAGSDVGALVMRARRDGDRYVSRARRPGSPTPAWPISTSSSRGPASQGREGITAFAVDADAAGLLDRRIDRDDLAAPDRQRALRRRRRAGEPANRRRRAGLQGRDGDPRRFSDDGRCGGTGIRASSARGDGCARQVAAAVRCTPGGASADAVGDRDDGDGRRRERAARVSSGFGRKIAAPSGLPARRRWRSGSPRRLRDASAIEPCNYSADAA